MAPDTDPLTDTGTDDDQNVVINSLRGLQQFSSDVIQAYRLMDMPVRTYFLQVLFPSVLVGAFIAVGGVIVFNDLIYQAPVALLSLFLPFVAIIFPKLQQDKKRRQIRQKFHLFLTHLTVLSLTNIDRVKIFRILSQEQEYDALAEEMGRITALVDTWNQSLDDACRMRAKDVPSPLLQDFLERLAYSISAGQNLQDFLINEQDTMIQEFGVRYEADLRKLDVIKELYLSMMLSSAFLLVFAVVLPILLGVNPTMVIMFALFLLLVVQGGFLYGIHAVAPSDPLWYHADYTTDRDRKIRRSVIIGIGGVMVLTAVFGGILFGYGPIPSSKIPIPLYVSIPTTPLLYPGYVMKQFESKVRERDGEFVSFIRSLGAVEGVKQTSTGDVLQSLRKKDFGALTNRIEHLYRRLNMRIDSSESWGYFAAECGSYLIQKFGEMYTSGRRLGGDPEQLGEIISDNMNEVLKLREKRQQETNTLRGVIYGLTAVTVFAYFVALQVVKVLLKITRDMNNQFVGSILHTGQYSLTEVKFMLMCLILLNAILSSIMIRLTDRGHFINSYLHFVTLTWMGALIAVFTNQMAGNFLSFGF